jgi:hypothetical protein
VADGTVLSLALLMHFAAQLPARFQELRCARPVFNR